MGAVTKKKRNLLEWILNEKKIGCFVTDATKLETTKQKKLLRIFVALKSQYLFDGLLNQNNDKFLLRCHDYLLLHGAYANPAKFIRGIHLFNHRT